MPAYVCSDCISIFEYSYQFKQMCKKADNLLRQYPLTGKWPAKLEKPTMPRSMTALNSLTPKQVSKTTQIRMQPANQNINQESLLLPKKILNVGVEDNDITATATNNDYSQTITKVEKNDEDCNITFLDKIDNNDELSIDDIQLLVASEDVAEEEFVKIEAMPKPKLLNKSSVRILNKDANRDKEPRLSLPKIKKSQDGNMEIVAEILSADETYEEEPDPKNAEPIETNIFPCPHCDRTFPLVQLRDIHLKNHLRDRKFQCDECDKSFFSKYDLQRHSFIHNGAKPYKCSACDKAFSRTSLLTRHEKIHTDIPKYICVHCERSFISKEDMNKHAERHNINRPYQCKVCNKGFAFKQGLERHEVVHSRQQPYSCQYCNLSFSTTTKLARHLTAHAGRRPFPCKVCKKSYLLSHHLTRHMRSHKNVENIKKSIIFICSNCNTNFASRDELISHSKTHANERNLTCPLCKEMYSDMNTLTSHIQDHSEGEAYACEFCDLIFMTAQKLQSHTDLDHIQEMEAYHEDDRAQADKKSKETHKQEIDISDENLQSVVNEFLMNDGSDDGNDSNIQLKKEKTTGK